MFHLFPFSSTSSVSPTSSSSFFFFYLFFFSYFPQQALKLFLIASCSNASEIVLGLCYFLGSLWQTISPHHRSIVLSYFNPAICVLHSAFLFLFTRLVEYSTSQLECRYGLFSFAFLRLADKVTVNQ